MGITAEHLIRLYIGHSPLVQLRLQFLFLSNSQERDGSDAINWSERIMNKCHIPNIFKDDVPNPPPDYFTATFKANKLHK